MGVALKLLKLTPRLSPSQHAGAKAGCQLERSEPLQYWFLGKVSITNIAGYIHWELVLLSQMSWRGLWPMIPLVLSCAAFIY